MLSPEVLRARTPDVACSEGLVRIGSAPRCGDGVHITSAAGSLARLQCLEMTRIGSSETGTCKGLHENTLHECVLNLHVHAPSEQGSREAGA